MKLYFQAALALLVIACLNACEPGIKVTQDYDKSANFAQYKTFAIDTFRMSQSVNQLNQNRIINAVKDEMTKKGFTESGSPDLLVHISAIIENQKSVSSNTSYSGGYGYGGYYRPYGWGGGMGSSYTTYSVDNYKNGSLIIDIVDAKNKNLVWEGIGNKDIDTDKDPNKAIPAAVTKIMVGFPPGTAKK